MAKVIYKKEYADQVEKLAATGDTYVQIAVFFGISNEVLNKNWMHIKEFREAYLRGRDRFTQKGVEKSLLKRILGYYYWEITEAPRMFLKEEASKPEIMRDNLGKPVLEVKQRVRKHVPADSTLLIFQLTNRDAKRWKHIRRMEISDLMGMEDDGQLTPDERNEAIDFARYRAEKLLKESRDKAKGIEPDKLLKVAAASQPDDIESEYKDDFLTDE